MDQDVPMTGEHELKDLLLEVLRVQELILRRLEELEQRVGKER